MTVNDLQCPNCGAPIDFAGSTQAICSFCQSKLYFTPEGVKTESVLNDVLKGKPATAGIDLSGILEQLRAGKKIEAIKLYREQTGLGLKEAKDAVEAIERGETPELTLRVTSATHGVSGVDLDQITELLLQNKKIDAIKLYREQTGLGLKEAKDAVEAIERGETPALPSPRLLATAPHPYSIDLDSITALARQGNKIGAIKLYREQTGVGLKEAKDAVEAIARGEMPVVTIDQHRGAPETSTQSRGVSTFSGCLGCLPILLFVGLCAGLIMFTSQIAFRAWGPLDQVMQILNNDPQVTQAFGQPLNVGPFITGSISGGDTSSSAHFSVPLYGPQRSGTLQVSGSWRRGVWDISISVLYAGEDGEEQTIYITQKVK